MNYQEHQVATTLSVFEDDVRYLSDASAALRDLAILAADTGLRPNSELFPLEWDNVEFESSDEIPSGFIHVARGKSKNAIRNVPSTERAREVLLRRQQQSEGSRYVFPGVGITGHIVTVQHPMNAASSKLGFSFLSSIAGAIPSALARPKPVLISFPWRV
jgi:integrase